MAKIVCLHGLGFTSASFEALASRLEDHEVIRPDFAGHPSRLKDAYAGSPLTFSSNECCEIASRGFEGVVLIGHSMGGAVACLALRHSKRISALVLIEGNLTKHCGRMSRILAATRTDQELCEARDELVKAARSYGRHSWEQWAEGVQRMRPQVLRDYASALVKFSDSGAILHAFQAFRGPKCFIYGDGYLGHLALQEVPPEVQAHVPDAQHFVMQDQPEACAATIRAMLS